MNTLTAQDIVKLVTAGITDLDELDDLDDLKETILSASSIRERDILSVTVGDHVFLPTMSDYTCKSVEFITIAGFEEVLGIDISLNDGLCQGSVFHTIDGYVGDRFLILMVTSYDDTTILIFK